MRSTSRKGFTLVEVVIVVTVIIIMTAAALQGTVRTQRQFQFNYQYNLLMSMMRKARDLSISSQTVADPAGVDYDNDGQTGDDVLPQGYGTQIAAGSSGSDHIVTLFLDMPGTTKGSYDPAGTPADTMIEEITIPADDFDLYMFTNSTGAGGSKSTITSYYTPPYGFPQAASSYYITLRDPQENREKSILLHKISGIPEPY